MPNEYEAVRYEVLRPADVLLRREAAPIAYVPMGSLEWHAHSHSAASPFTTPI